jgi:hypothetical protein
MRPDVSESSQISSSTTVRLPELLVAIHASRQSCSKAGKARIFALVWESSGEPRFNAYLAVARRLKPKVRS